MVIKHFKKVSVSMLYNKQRQLKQYIILVGTLFITTYLLNSCETGSSAQNTEAALYAGPDTETRDEITIPPSILHLDAFYKKYLSASGIPVISSANVPDEALYAVQRTVNAMITIGTYLVGKMIENKARV